MRKLTLALLLTTFLIAPVFAQTGTQQSQSAISSEINNNLIDNTTGLITPRIVRQTLQDFNASAINGVSTDQSLLGGATYTSFSMGTLTTGTTTMDCGKGPLQYFTNNGTASLGAPTNDGSCIVLMTNGTGSISALTFSGFNVGSNTGDALTTTAGNKFSISMWRINGTSGYTISAHQ
jgi:hypothetical protein